MLLIDQRRQVVSSGLQINDYNSWRLNETPALICHFINFRLIHYLDYQSESVKISKYICPLRLITYLRPVIISFAPMKLPTFQHVIATRNKHPNAARRSSGNNWDRTIYVVHEQTSSKRFLRFLMGELTRSSFTFPCKS